MKRITKALSAMLILSLLVVNSFSAHAAINNAADIWEVDIDLDIKKDQLTKQEDKGELIDELTAGKISLLFIAGNIEETIWNKNTVISCSTLLFDCDDVLSAYCFQLETDGKESGYVIVSAWSGTQLIQEYSDQASPLFATEEASFHCDPSADLIYYLGNLVFTTEKTAAKEIGCLLDYSNKTASQNQLYLDVVKKIEVNPYGESFVKSGPIQSPLEYILYSYGSSAYTLTSSASLYIPFYEIPDTNACTIAAIAGVIYVNRYTITNSYPSWSTIYNTCKQVAVNGGYYTPSGGVPHPTQLANAILSYYGCSWTASSSFISTYSVSKNQIDSGRAVVTSILLGYYGDHSVASYGYSLYTDPMNDKIKFLKVRDGWTQPGNTQYDRYVCINSTTGINTTSIKP